MPRNHLRHPYPPVRSSAHSISAYILAVTLLLAGVAFGMVMCDRQPAPVQRVEVPVKGPVVLVAKPVAKPRPVQKVPQLQVVRPVQPTPLSVVVTVTSVPQQPTSPKTPYEPRVWEIQAP